MPLKILFIVLTVVLSCDGYNKEEVICLPVNMTATIVQGIETKKIIADFHYIPETDMLDHITWSNHQTHYFEYNEAGRLMVVRQMKVNMKVQEEMWFNCDGSLVDRVVLVKRNLDYRSLEPIDSIYTGYIEFEYEGKNIIKEKRYKMSGGGMKKKVVGEVEYEYDAHGNVLSRRASDPRTESTESFTMTYDNNKHPFSGLQYYFSGESFVNNLLSKSIEEDDLSYSYDLRLNDHGYPEIVYEKLGITNSRIIRYSYTCN
ncbi:MAG: hypothetical protein KAR19_06365 [Bacteroidales bacterium]|nr:hypothetical protein [Bacteroidales bacterium]